MTRLLTEADVDDSQTGRGVQVSARHELELDDGRRILLLNDRGWGSTASWTAMSVREISETTRVVVGPDEPFGDRSQEDVEADHWASLQQTAQQQGVFMEVTELRQLPHHVILTPRLLARVAGGPDTSSSTS